MVPEELQTAILADGIGQRIAERRKALGMTQPQLGAMIGRRPEAISRWEHGHAELKVSSLLALAEALGVTPDDLLGVKKP